MVEEVIRGVPTRVWRAAPQSLRQIWEGSRVFADRDYLVYRDERYTFERAHTIVSNLAGRLAGDYGIGRGDRFAIAMRNYPEWVLAFWAGAVLGAVGVPLNAWWTGPKLAYGLADSGSRVLFADRERLERLAPHLEQLELEAIIAVREGDLPARAVGFDDLIAGNGERQPLPDIAVDPDDDATILYTSGTTGKPKGAVGTQRNICSFLFNIMYAGAARTAGLPAPPSPATTPPPPATLLTFPLFHVGGLQSHLLPYTAFGGKLVLMYKWDADEAVDMIEREKVTSFSGVPTTAFQLLERAAERGVSLASLEGLSSGATLVPPELVRRVDQQFASRVAPGNGYGLTETSGAMIGNFGADYVARPDSVGKPLTPVNEVRVVDET